MTDTQPSIHDRLEAATGLNGDTLRGQLADQGLTVELETITDRAAIRDSDEPSERGDFPCCSGARAAGGTVGALDLDAIEAAALADDGWWSVPAFALVAEVRSLRAKVAAVEALLKAGAGWLWVGEPEGWAVLVSDLRAALATGEGK